MNTPVLVQSLKLSNFGSSQYLDGWPPGKTEVTKYIFCREHARAQSRGHILEATACFEVTACRNACRSNQTHFWKKNFLSSNNGQKEHAFHLFISILTLIIFLNIFLWNLFYLFLFETNYKRHLNTIFFIFLL